MRKEDALAAVDAMDAEFDLDALIQRLIVINQITIGRADVEAGQVLSLEDVEAAIEEWSREAKPGSDAA